MTAMTAKPDTDAVAEVHVAGPLEEAAVQPGTVVLVQRCLRCDIVLAEVTSRSGASFRVGTRIGVLFDKGNTRMYVLDRHGLADGEENCRP